LGIGTLRIPTKLGGPGGTISDYIEMIATIGSGDSNIAHALRSHFNFTETLVLNPDAPGAREAIGHVLDGKLFAGAHTELGTKRPGEVTTTLTRDGDRWRLNGRKWYATGSAFADFVSFTAHADDGRFVSVLLPAARKGIAILDDWDGMGQKLTASGGVLLENVEVLDTEIRVHALDSRIGRHASASRQLHLAACAGGAVRAVLREGTEYVRKQARSAAHSHAETAREDFFVQKVIGEIAARSYAIDAMISEAARKLDLTADAFTSGNDTRIEAALVDAALAVARTQLILADLGLKAAEQIFELGGGSATSTKYNFDRHWRNIRTVLNHNPLLHKARVVGDYLLNGTTTHLEEGKVF
jgi:alkylation response protein AidB-like acyl-CoA dehydrogenase